MRLLNTVSLKLVVISLFVSILTIMFGLAVFLQLRSENRVFDSLSDKVTSAYIESVQTNLFNFLKVPIQANASVEMSMQQALTGDSVDMMKLEPSLIGTLQRVFPYSPQLSLLAFGSVNGDYIGVSRETVTDKLTLILKDQRTHGVLNFYSGLDVNTPVINRVRDYDPRVRPWFRMADKTRKSFWTTAYWDLDAVRGISISYSTPVYDIEQRYVGVVSTDIKLDKFNRYLQELPNLGNGVIFIVNGANEIISHSTDEKKTTIQTSELTQQENVQLLKPVDSESIIVRTMAPYLSDMSIHKTKFTVGDETYYGRMVPFGEELGLHNWRIIVAVPRSDFVGFLDVNRKVTISLILFIFIAGVALAWIILSKITTPILQVAKQARLIAKLKWSPTQQSHFEIKEIKLLNDAFNDMSSTLSKAFSSLKHQVYYDSVTGLLSKEGLQERMRELVAQGEQQQWKCLILVSLDNMTEMNNSLGYQKGESLLREFVKHLLAIVPPDALLAKVNDVEFAICYPKTCSSEACSQEMNKYIQLYARSQGYEGEHLLFSGNIGFLQDEFDDRSLADSLRNASVALVAARKKGSGAYEVYHPEMMSRAVENTQMLAELSQAQNNDELLVYFQPIVNLSDSHIVGAEALIRWRSKAYGMVPPNVFIPLAEESGLILSIGRWILRESCRQLALKIQSGWPADFDIHINVSARQLMQADFYDLIVKTIGEFNLSPINLTLELTESLFVEKRTIITEQLERIRALGVSIAIDDFGSGFSSLSYLYRLKFDCLKIDRDFVSGVLENARSQAIISSVIRLASGLSVPLVAEGIETAEVAEQLRELGCPRGQGYYFGRPIPLNEWPIPIYDK
ncbi:bifunctional diguanylate cyclase/phosphodiesterase [Pragia fontium]|nr:EAL domain-containing protein [Pragia fontium]